MSVHQKLGIIIENKVVKKLNLENNVLTEKWYSGMKKKMTKIQLIFDIEGIQDCAKKY